MCLYPKLIKNRKYTSNKKNGGNVPVPVDERVLAVPVGCGKCIECRKQKSREWQVRLLEDVRKNKNGIFVTLTFSNESIKELTEVKVEQLIKKGENITTKEIIQKGYELDNMLAKTAVRRFLERWRKKYKKSLRHWLVTELGHTGTENIHLHGIIWTDEKPEKIEEYWQYGYVWAGNKKKNGEVENYVNEKTVNYITKYINKTDKDHEEYKPKILTSAGIGSSYIERTDSKKNEYKDNGETIEYYKTRSGHKTNIPPYLRNKIYSEEQREKLWIEKLNKKERWVMGVKIDVSKNEDKYLAALNEARRKNKRLGYGDDSKNWSKKEYERQRRALLIEKRIEGMPPAGTSSRPGIAPGSAESINDALKGAQGALKPNENW